MIPKGCSMVAQNSQGTPEGYPKDAQRMPTWYPTYTLGYPKDAQRMPKVCRMYAQRRPKGGPKDAQRIPKGYPKDTQRIPKGYPKDTKMIPKGYPGCPQKMPKSRIWPKLISSIGLSCLWQDPTCIPKCVCIITVIGIAGAGKIFVLVCLFVCLLLKPKTPRAFPQLSPGLNLPLNQTFNW